MNLDKFLLTILVGALAAILHTDLVDAVKCYQCDHVAHPRDCARINECKSGEICSVMGYVQADGHFYFKTGCRKASTCPARGVSAIGRRDLAFCNLCCDGDYCNKALCDRTHVAHEGKRCLKCDTVEHPSHCGAVTECKPGESCFTKEITVFGEKRFSLGCAYTQGCVPTTSKYRSIMTRQTSAQCLQCCDGENCNGELCKNTGSHTGSQVVTTRKPAPVVHTNPPATAAPAVTTPRSHTFFPILNGCLYNGRVYKQDESWVDGCDYNCTCSNATRGRYVCTDYCPSYVYLPTRCTLVKAPGECCAKPVCNNTVTTTTNFTSSVLLDHCLYKGKNYKQNEVWQDGCEFECECINATHGHYRCSTLCYTWTLPSACHMEPPKAGKCCKTPACPPNYNIHYPPNYKEN